MLYPTSKLVIATTNKGKVKEFIHRLAKESYEIFSLSDFNEVPPVVEDGDTFQANAEIKARAIGDALNMISIADDSGLCVEALQGDPGVYSARYAGEHATDEENVGKLLQELNQLVDCEQPYHHSIPIHPLGYKLLSPAYFSCALVLYDYTKDMIISVEESCPGWIVEKPCGEGGFGYDPIFYLPEFGRTMAELTIEEKSQISHRGKAIESLLSQLEL